MVIHVHLEDDTIQVIVFCCGASEFAELKSQNHVRTYVIIPSAIIAAVTFWVSVYLGTNRCALCRHTNPINQNNNKNNNIAQIPQINPLSTFSGHHSNAIQYVPIKSTGSSGQSTYIPPANAP